MHLQIVKMKQFFYQLKQFKRKIGFIKKQTNRVNIENINVAFYIVKLYFNGKSVVLKKSNTIKHQNYLSLTPVYFGSA